MGLCPMPRFIFLLAQADFLCACHAERSEESRLYTQDKLREEPSIFYERKKRDSSANASE